MKPISNYEKIQPLISQNKLPAGGYIIKILDAEEVTFPNSQALKISFDIIEGEYKNYYTINYKNQKQEDKKWKGVYHLFIPKEDGSENDEWTKSKFRTCMDAVEESNPGYRWEWDESTLKGKIAGAIMRDKEWKMNGRTGFTVEVYTLETAEKIRENKFSIPNPRLLPKKNAGASNIPNIPDDTEDDLPDWLK